MRAAAASREFASRAEPAAPTFGSRRIKRLEDVASPREGTRASGSSKIGP
jgi:hypothetical protein